MKKQAFTLVELIVVITILAILGTIGFISLQGFSIDARDSKRISELSEIRSGLQIYQARNMILPTPSEQSVTIGSGTTDLIIQGYVGESVLNKIKMNGNPKDPLDNNKYYTYSVNATKTKFQLLSLLENDDNLTLYIIPTTHASYTNRHLYVLGQNVGILLDEVTNTPLNELQSGVLDLSTDTVNYKTVFLDTKNTEILSGFNLHREIIAKSKGLNGWRAKDFNCEIEDITIGDQVWAGCNSTLGDGIEYSVNEDCYDYQGGTTTGCNRPSNEKENIYNPTYGVDNIWGKLYMWVNSASACPTGRNVPSYDNWTDLENYLAGTPCRTTTGFQCDGLGWKENISYDPDRKLIEKLKLPLAGYRHYNETTFKYRGNTTFLWSSTSDISDNSNAFRRGMQWDNSAVYSDIRTKNYGFSVRCIKNN